MWLPWCSVAGYFAFGMPGMDHGTPPDDGGSTAAVDHDAMSFMRLDPETFAARLGDPRAFVVNVHTPYQGELEGTDAFIPYDQIGGHARLPGDKGTEILLYCRSGRMSAIAAEALMDAGYTDVVDLAGGMDAWEADGRPVHSASAEARG